MERNDLNTVKEDCIYIDNVPQHIYNICTKAITQKGFDLLGDSIFMAISAYFRDNLESLSKKHKIKLQSIMFSFLVSTSWIARLDTLKLVMVTLLGKAGVVFPSDPNDGIIFITKLEDHILSTQFDPAIKNPEYIHPGNRCMMYDTSFDDDSVTVSPIYFQLKEDSSLKLFQW